MEERRTDKKEVPLTMKENVIPDHTRGQGTTVASHGHDHEYRDISFRSIIRFAVSIVLLVLVAYVLMWGAFELLADRAAKSDTPVSPVASRTQVPPGPRLQASAATDMRSFRAHEDSLLNGYGWVDKGTGVARIPIGRAIDIVAQRGLPVRAGGMNADAATTPADRSTPGAPQSGTGLERGSAGNGDSTRPLNDYGGRGPIENLGPDDQSHGR
jgi:hypothetical protein